MKRLSLFICSETNCGGETIVTFSLAKALKKNRYLKTSLHLNQPLENNRFMSFYAWQIISIIRWFKLIKNDKTINVLYTTTFTAGVAAIIFKKVRGIKIIFHFHGNRIPPRYINSNLIHSFFHNIKRISTLALHKLFIKNCDLIIVPSKTSIQKIKKLFDKYPAKKIVIVPNGIDLKKFKSGSEPQNILRKTMKLPLNDIIILSIGRINHKKGVYKLIKVFHELSKKRRNIKLVIAHPKIILEQEKKYKLFILKEIEKFNLKNNIIWKVNHKPIRDLYFACDIVLSLSRVENLPLTLIEAFAAGKPYLSTNKSVKHILLQIDPILIPDNSNTIVVTKYINRYLSASKKDKEKIINKEIIYSKKFSLVKMSSSITGLVKKLYST